MMYEHELQPVLLMFVSLTEHTLYTTASFSSVLHELTLLWLSGQFLMQKTKLCFESHGLTIRHVEDGVAADNC